MGGFALVRPLLVSRVRMVVNGVVRGDRERRAWLVVVGIVACGGMLASYRFAGAVLSIDAPGPDQLERVVAGGLLLLSGFTLVTSITFALGSLFFARDLDTLLSAPVPPRAILLTRMVTQLGFGAALGVLIAGPPAAAYAFHEGAPLALPFVMLAVLALVTWPLVVGVVLTVVAVRLTPARYVRDAGGLVVTLVVFGVTAVNVLLRGADAFTSGRPGALDLNRYGGGPADNPWLPSGWAARVIVRGIGGDLGQAVLWLSPLLAGALLLPLLASRVVERAYVIGYQRNGAASRGRVRTRTPGRASGRRHRVPQWGWLVLMGKDFREIRRDASQLGQLLLPLVLFAFYLARPIGAGDLGNTLLPSWYSTALTAAFASMFAASGIALRGIGSEGTRMWLLRVSPLPLRQLLAAKFLVGFMISSLLGVLLMGIGAHRDHTSFVAALWPTVLLLFVIGGLVGLATGMGALRPRLDWTDPRRAVGAGVGFLFLVLGSGYLGVAFIILVVPYALHATGALATGIADALLIAFAVITAGSSLAVGSTRLRRIEL